MKLNLTKRKILVLVSIIFGAIVFLSAGIFAYLHFCRNIYIVFNTDRNYKEYTKVAIASAIINKKERSKYKINVLCVDLSEDERKEFEEFSDKNVTVKTVPLELSSIERIENYEMEHYVSRADLFKFFIPELFPKINKILYIDSDTLILSDLSDLYNTNISKYPLAAVKKPDYFAYLKDTEDGKTQVKKVYSYNCGVILFNAKFFRDNKITKNLINSKNNYKIRTLQTQANFNMVIKIKQIKLLSPIYNTYARLQNSDFETYEFKKIYKPFLDDINSMNELRKKAVIVHFAGPNKPWKNDNIYFGKVWWAYAKVINPDWKLEKQ